MAGSLGTLTLDLVAKISNFIGPLDQAEQASEQSTQSMSGKLKKMGDFAKENAGVMIAAAGSAAVMIGAMTAEYIENANQLELMAYKAQSTTQEFQKSSLAAKQMGIEAEELSDIYKDFNEKLGEFVTVGGGGALDFFEQVAIKTEGSAEGAMKLAKEMANLSGPQAMELYVKKMQEANLSQDQMSFLMESMASESTMLIPLLKNNAEGMRLWGDAAERAGIILDTETMVAAKGLKVEMGLLTMQMEGAKNQVMQALIPAFVDISSTFLSSEGNTISLKSSAEGLGNTLRWLSKIGLGVVSIFDIVGTVLGGGAAAMMSADVSAEDVIKDLEAKVAAYGMKFDRLDGENTTMNANDKQRLIEIEQERLALQQQQIENQTAETKGAQEWIDKQNESEKVTQKQTKANQKLASSKNDVARAYEDARRKLYEYATEFERIEHDFTEEKKEISSSVLKTADKLGMIAEAKSISDARKQIYLLEYESDVDSYLWSEEIKINKTLALEKQKINATRGMHKSERDERIKGLENIANHELAWLRLEQNQRLQDANEAFQTEMQNLTARFEFERENIRLNNNLEPDEKKMMINASYRLQDMDSEDAKRGAWFDYQDEMGVDTSAAEKAEKRAETIKNAYDWQLITQEEYQSKMLESESMYQNSRLALAMDFSSSYLGATADVLKAVLGEQSTAYKVAFTMQKAATLASITMKAPETYANVLASASAIPLIGPYIAPAMAAGAIALQYAQAATVGNVNLGFADGGYTGDGAKYEYAGPAHKGEVVFSQADVKRAGGVRNVENLRKYGNTNQNAVNVSIQINNNTNAHVDARQNSDGTVTIDIVDQRIAQSWNNVRRGNSNESQSIQQAFGLSPTR